MEMQTGGQYFQCLARHTNNRLKANWVKITAAIILIATLFILPSFSPSQLENRILYHVVSPQENELVFFWKNESGENYKDFQRLKQALNSKGKLLKFAMNGGMYQTDLSPQGLYVENGKVLSPLNNRQKGYGNFYMQPNGIFYITNNLEAHVTSSDGFTNENVKYATQSGPMLVINGTMHHRFIKGSENLNIRNGVGILPNGDVLFAISKDKINFYDFATFFMEKGCENALYLDGFVSKVYSPANQREDIGGTFGVIIAEVE